VPFKPDSDSTRVVVPVQPTVEAGLVRPTMDKPWLGDFLGEIGAFPVGVHDEQVDAFVMAINYLHHSGVMSAEKAMELVAATWFGIVRAGGRTSHQIGIEMAERQLEMERRYRICEACGEPVESSYITTRACGSRASIRTSRFTIESFDAKHYRGGAPGRSGCNAWSSLSGF
jgi:hypothetical protein